MSNGSNAGQSEGTAGVGMMVAAYVDELGADQAFDSMKQAKKEGSFYYDDAAVIRQDPKGKVHIEEMGDMSTGEGTGIGALIGGVIGILGGPAGVALGAAGGAAIGAIAAHGDAGFSQDSLKEIGGALLPGSSAIAAITSKEFVEAVRKQAPDTDRISVARELASTIHEALQARKDILLGLVVTEEGIAATRVESSPSEVAVFGIAATEEGVVAAAAVATEEGAAYVAAAADEEGTAYEAGVATDEGTAVADAYVPADEASSEASDEAAAEEKPS